jgi:hypothetical protein
MGVAENDDADLDASGLESIDAALLRAATGRWLKVARVVCDALKAGGFSTSDDALDLHVRRLIRLVESGRLDAQGNLRRPRWSEVRLPRTP